MARRFRRLSGSCSRRERLERDQGKARLRRSTPARLDA